MHDMTNTLNIVEYEIQSIIEAYWFSLDNIGSLGMDVGHLPIVRV